MWGEVSSADLLGSAADCSISNLYQMIWGDRQRIGGAGINDFMFLESLEMGQLILISAGLQEQAL